MNELLPRYLSIHVLDVGQAVSFRAGLAEEDLRARHGLQLVGDGIARAHDDLEAHVNAEQCDAGEDESPTELHLEHANLRNGVEVLERIVPLWAGKETVERSVAVTRYAAEAWELTQRGGLYAVPARMLPHFMRWRWIVAKFLRTLSTRFLER
ncbi:MAG TPA: hypothetical protein VK843_12640 [Planctomycetota bacterium]|nr:hypothetical protein [Planctomycetota bacterium]